MNMERRAFLALPLKTDEDGTPLCPSCGTALVGAYIEQQGGTEVVYEHSDFIARKFTTPCVVRASSHAEALAALNELPEDWIANGPT